MSVGEILTNAYIDANVLLLFTLIVWFAIRLTLRATGLSPSQSTQQRLLRLGFLTALLAPVAAYLLAQTPLLGAASPLSSISLSDYVISQYIQGRLALDSSQLDALLSARRELARNVGATAGQIGTSATILFAIGLLVFGSALLRSILMLHRIVGDCHAWRRIGSLHLVLSDSIAAPFATRSLRRKYIVLPTAMLCSRDDLRFAIAHEAQHLRSGDVGWEIFFQALKPLFFWNPAYHLWNAQARRLRELACDQSVVSRKRFEVRAYCDFLLRVTARCRRASRPALLATAAVPVAAFGLSLLRRRAGLVLRQRVLSLLDGTEAGERPSVFHGAGLLLVTIVLLAAFGIQQHAEMSAQELQLSTIVNHERFMKIRSEPGYNLVMAY